MAGNKQTEKPHKSDRPHLGSTGITATASTTAASHNMDNRCKTGGLAMVLGRSRRYTDFVLLKSSTFLPHLISKRPTSVPLVASWLDRRIRGILQRRSKYSSAGSALYYANLRRCSALV